MRKCGVICLILMLSFAVNVVGSLENLKEGNNHISTTYPSKQNITKHMKFAAGGEEYLKTNILAQGNFEEADEHGIPVEISYYGSPYSYVNFTYDRTHEGSKAALLYGKGTVLGEATTYIRSSSHNGTYYAQVVDGLILDLWFYIEQVPDLVNNSLIYFRLWVYNEAIGRYRHMYYIVNYHSLWRNNNTNEVYFYDNHTISQWHNFHRNITADFMSYFTDTISDCNIRNVELDVLSPLYSIDYTKVVVDGISLKDKYNSEFINNGDFESGSTYWQTYMQGASSLSLTNVHTTGEKAMNMTATSFKEDAYSYVEAEFYLAVYQDIAIGRFVNNSNELVLSFDWLYSDVANSGDSVYAELELDLTNTTHNIYAHYFLGNIQDTISYINYTTGNNIYIYFISPNLGTRDIWVHENLDIYELFRANFTHLLLKSIQFEVSSGTFANSSTTLLIDNLELMHYPFNDPSFEEDFYYSNTQPITTWYSTANSNYINHTTDAHSGKYAVNITGTSYGGKSVNCYNIFVAMNKGMYADFWYKVTKIDPSYLGYASFIFEFNNSYDMYYVIANGSNFNYSNDSNTIYYIINEFTSYSWTELVRDLYTDVSNAFGEGIWFLTGFEAEVFPQSGETITVLFDDVYLVQDTHPPEISNVQIANTPVYYQPTSITFEVTENLGEITSAKVYYRNDSSWFSLEATLLSGNTYTVTLPPASFGTTYQFYIEVSDSSDLVATDTNSGSYYTFTVGDDVRPSVEIINPGNSSIIKDSVVFEAYAIDEGSSIERVEFYVDSHIIDNITTAPFEITWNSRSVENGWHNISVIAFDEAGNFASDFVLIQTDNDFEAPIISVPQLLPDPLKPNKPVSVLVAVSDATAVATVTLYYAIGNQSWSSITMTNNGSLYTGEIAAPGYNTEVKYYIKAVDIYGQESYQGTLEQPLTFIIKPTISTIYTNYGMALGAAAVVLLYGIIRLIVWRVKKK